MLVEVIRTASNKHGTFGTFQVDGQPICLTLEETWLGNQRMISCIPEGKYKCTKYSGTKYKDVWLVNDVPNRSAILLHWGNTEANTAGCILFGRTHAKFGDKHGIGRSKEAFNLIRKTLPNDFVLTIKDCFDKDGEKPQKFTKKQEYDTIVNVLKNFLERLRNGTY